MRLARVLVTRLKTLPYHRRDTLISVEDYCKNWCCCENKRFTSDVCLLQEQLPASGAAARNWRRNKRYHITAIPLFRDGDFFRGTAGVHQQTFISDEAAAAKSSYYNK
jgi:hypothetical protein